MKLFAVIKSESVNGSLMEPFVKAICSSLSAAVNAAEHIFDEAVKSDFPNEDMHVIYCADTYKRAVTTYTARSSVVVKVQEISCELQFAC